MQSQSVQQLLFSNLVDRPVVVKRADFEMSSDAGLLPIREFDRRWRLTERMIECLEDNRSRHDHSLAEMLRQRLFGILADYEDCNDHDDLRHDPVFKIVAGKSVNEDALASQPTLSRFENSITPKMLERLRTLLVTTGIEQLRQKNNGQLPDNVTLDIDPTDVTTHGQQQLTMFHGYYDQHQYFPQIITEPTTQHAFFAQLRHGSMHPAKGADECLLAVIDPLRQQRPDIAIHVRADSGFGAPALYEMLENKGFSYIIGLTGNPRLERATEVLMAKAVTQFEQTGQKQRLFSVFEYRAKSWHKSRTVIAKAEASRNGTNLRFVVTNQWVGSARHAEQRYDEYVQRGTSEQRNDELKNGLSMDRLSCHRFMANFWRLLLHVHAYNLLNALRDSDEVPTELQHAQPARWRTRLIKVAARVVQSTRRIVLELSASWPHWDVFAAVTNRLPASSRAP
jgi:hypothetical protein